MLTSSEGQKNNDDWRRWCSLPYLPRPDQDSYFMQFFSRAWKDSLRESLINFLRAIFQNLSPPSLLGISIFQTERQRSQAQIKTIKSECALYRQECQQAKDSYASILCVLKEINACVNQSKPFFECFIVPNRAAKPCRPISNAFSSSFPSPSSSIRSSVRSHALSHSSSGDLRLR